MSLWKQTQSEWAQGDSLPSPFIDSVATEEIVPARALGSLFAEVKPQYAVTLSTCNHRTDPAQTARIMHTFFDRCHRYLASKAIFLGILEMSPGAYTRSAGEMPGYWHFHGVLHLPDVEAQKKLLHRDGSSERLAPQDRSPRTPYQQWFQEVCDKACPPYQYDRSPIPSALIEPVTSPFGWATYCTKTVKRNTSLDYILKSESPE